jgi:hypothetical protein
VAAEVKVVVEFIKGIGAKAEVIVVIGNAGEIEVEVPAEVEAAVMAITRITKAPLITADIIVHGAIQGVTAPGEAIIINAVQ